MADSATNEERFPQYPREQQLEDRSIDELRALLRGYFLVRDQRAPRDFGVDVTIEILLGDQATNYTSMVQVKARSNQQARSDGSQSLRIGSTNVDYLLGAAMSHVVLYDADNNRFYCASVLDEVVRQRADGIDYREQGTITLHMSRELRRDSVEAFRDELLAQARAMRQLRHQFAGMSAGNILHVDSNAVGVTTDDVEIDFFKRGWRLAAQGELQEVERLFGLLSAASRAGGRAQLLVAHANACNGRLIAAWMYASEARRRLEKLTNDDIDLLELIELGLDLFFGRASADDALRRGRVIQDRAKPDLRIQLEASVIRQEMTISSDPMQFGVYATRARELVAESTKALGAQHVATLTARALEQELTGRAFSVEYAHLQLTAVYRDTPMGLQMRGGVKVADAIERMHRSLREWFARNNAALNDSAQWPLLRLELEKGDGLMQMVLLRHTRLMAATDGMDATIDLSREPAATLLTNLTALRDQARTMRVDVVESQAQLLRTELFDLAERADDVRREATELYAHARACGYKQVEAEALAFMEGRSMFRLERAKATRNRGFNSDQELVARASADERDEIADTMCEVLRLPARSRPIMRDEIEREATTFLLRETFCRHLEVHTEIRREADELAYAKRPSCRCMCRPRRAATMLGSSHWQAIVSEFRRNYCDGCTTREPASPK